MQQETPQVPSAATRPGPWRARLGWVGGALLGLVLLVAVFFKAIDPGAFAEQVRAEGLDFLLSARVIVWVALAIEAGLGAALLLGLRHRSVLWASAALVAFFLFLTGRAAWRAHAGIADPAAGCGCFGNLVDRSPTEAFLQDLLMMVPALALAWWGAAVPRRARAVAVAAVATAGLAVATAIAAPQLPLDDLATRLSPGAELTRLCVGRGVERVCLSDLAPELTQGRHLAVIGEVDDPRLAARVPELNAYMARREATSDAPPVTLLADFDLDRSRRLFFEWAPSFALQAAPKALLRPLYRTLPRSFLVEDGRVVATYSGLPPQLAAAGAVPSGEPR